MVNFKKYINDQKAYETIEKQMSKFTESYFKEGYHKYRKTFVKKIYKSAKNVQKECLINKKNSLENFITKFQQNKNKLLIIEYILPNLLVYFKFKKKLDIQIQDLDLIQLINQL